MRKLLAAAALAAAVIAPAAFADETPKYSTKTTTIGALLANEETKKAFAEVLPEVASNEQIEMAAEMTLPDIQPMAQGMITDEKLKELDAKLAEIK
jgi:opacity protein-like surface antigen